MGMGDILCHAAKHLQWQTNGPGSHHHRNWSANMFGVSNLDSLGPIFPISATLAWASNSKSPTHSRIGMNFILSNLVQECALSCFIAHIYHWARAETLYSDVSRQNWFSSTLRDVLSSPHIPTSLSHWESTASAFNEDGSREANQHLKTILLGNFDWNWSAIF